MPLTIHSQSRSYVILVIVIITFTIAAIALGYTSARKSSSNLYQEITSFQQQVAEKNLLLSQIQALVGYGGIIHNFKNYIIRRDPALVTEVDEQITQLHLKVRQYLNLPVIEPEVEALQILIETIDHYQENLHAAVKLNATGITTSELDSIVRISDADAVAAISGLNLYLEQNANAYTNTLVDLNNSLRSSEYRYLMLVFGSVTIGWVALIVIFRRSLTNALVRIRNSLEGILDGELPDAYREPSPRGRITKVVTQINDLVERAKTDSEVFAMSQIRLQKSEAFFETILESISNGIVILDRDGRIVDANNSAERMLKLPEEELISTSIFPFLSQESSFILKTQLVLGRHALDLDDRLDNIDIHIIDNEGDTFPARLDLHPIDMAGDKNLILSIFDLTEQRKEEQRLRHLIAEADAANVAKTNFLASVSHELRTPLNAILGFTQLLIEYDNKGLSEAQLDSLREVKYGGDYLLNLVNDVLDLAQIEAGILGFNTEPVELRRLIENVLNFARITCEESGIKLLKPANIPDVSFMADKTRLRQVLINLISNAVKYNTENGFVEVTVNVRDKAWVRISVRDSGIGIDPSKHHRVFQEFDRLDVQKDKAEGSGIGLSLSKKLVEGMGGRIDFTSVPGSGSTFWMEFTLLPAMQPILAPRQSTELYNIFVVTASDDLQLACDGALAEHEDISVRQFPMLATAAMRAMLTPPDLLIVDYTTVAISEADIHQWLQEASLVSSQLLLITETDDLPVVEDPRVERLAYSKIQQQHFAELKRFINRKFDQKIFEAN